MVPLQLDYTNEDIVLRRFSEVKYLGMVFTQTLTGSIRCKQHLPQRFESLSLFITLEFGLLIFDHWNFSISTFVRPRLEYCSVVWSPQHLQLGTWTGESPAFLCLVGVRLAYRYSAVPLDEVTSLLSLSSLVTTTVNPGCYIVFSMERSYYSIAHLVHIYHHFFILRIVV